MHVPRPRGGQPGNQNARKHGYYSGVFTGQDKANLNQAAENNITQQIVDLYLGKNLFGQAENSVTPEISANPDASK